MSNPVCLFHNPADEKTLLDVTHCLMKEWGASSIKIHLPEVWSTFQDDFDAEDTLFVFDQKHQQILVEIPNGPRYVLPVKDVEQMTRESGLKR